MNGAGRSWISELLTSHCRMLVLRPGRHNPLLLRNRVDLSLILTTILMKPQALN
jgi:hypothetical protein